MKLEYARELGGQKEPRRCRVATPYLAPHKVVQLSKYSEVHLVQIGDDLSIHIVLILLRLPEAVKNSLLVCIKSQEVQLLPHRKLLC